MSKISENQFGGRWTLEKLEILRKYLNTYTTALKNQPFKLLYIDAFAGTGRVQQETQSPEEVDCLSFIDGSVNVALDIENKSFDELIFIETDPNKCSELEDLKRSRFDRNIHIENTDANQYLYNWCRMEGSILGRYV